MRLGRHNAAPLPAFLDAPEEYLRSVRTILASRENARATISWLPSDYSDSDVHEYDERIVRATESIRSEYPQADFKAFSTDVASEAEHADKNRYSDILPYDRTRVILGDRSTRSESFVNASWIKEPVRSSPSSTPSGSDGPGRRRMDRPRRWIAAQAPLPETTHDFLSMFLGPCLEEPNSDNNGSPQAAKASGITPKTILMLTACEESGRQKCARYWPAKVGESIDVPHCIPIQQTSSRSRSRNAHWQAGSHANIRVTWLSSVPSSQRDARANRGWRTNRFRLSYVAPNLETARRDSGPDSESQTTSQSTEINQVEYLGWQDHGVPEDPKEVIALLHHVNGLLFPSSTSPPSTKVTIDSSNPAGSDTLVVHCSAGVGRTGTYIALAWMLPLLAELHHARTSSSTPSQDELDEVVSNLFSGLKEQARRSPMGPLTYPDPPIVLSTTSPPSSSSSTHRGLLPSLLSRSPSPGRPSPSPRSPSEPFDPIMAVVDGLRDQRTTMVQTPEQVTFIYRACKVAYEQCAS